MFTLMVGGTTYACSVIEMRCLRLRHFHRRFRIAFIQRITTPRSYRQGGPVTLMMKRPVTSPCRRQVRRSYYFDITPILTRAAAHVAGRAQIHAKWRRLILLRRLFR